MRVNPMGGGNKTRAKANTGKPVTKQTGKTVLRSQNDGLASPRLRPNSEPHRVSVVPNPVDETTERFCTEGPLLQVPGMPATRVSTASDHQLTFPNMVARLEAIMGQAALLIIERVGVLQERHSEVEFLGPRDKDDLCDAADGIVAAAYHFQKWAVRLGSKEVQLPSKSFPCENVQEALSALRFAMPRIFISSKEVQPRLVDIIKEHQDTAEIRVEKLGIPIDDIRAMGPHLECVVVKLTRVSGAKPLGGPKIGTVDDISVTREEQTDIIHNILECG